MIDDELLKILNDDTLSTEEWIKTFALAFFKENPHVLQQLEDIKKLSGIKS